MKCKGRLCPNFVISNSVTVGTDALIVNVSSLACLQGCLVIAQTIPDAATINMPVAISIGGVTTTVYPLVGCNCIQVTASALRTRRRYPTRIITNATSAVFKSLGGLSCSPSNNLLTIPVTAAATAGNE